MEKFLFSNVKMWVLLLMLVLGLIGAVLFSSLAVHRITGGQRIPFFGQIALDVANFPRIVWRLVRGNTKLDNHEVEDRFAEEPYGFSVIRDPLPNPQYVLISRYDGNIGASVVELTREAEQDILHRWVFNDAENLAFESDNPFIMAPDPRQSNTMRTVHPWLSEDGNLYAHVHFGAMYRFDACSDVDWVNAEFMYHHSLERDADGNFWSVGTTTTEAVEYGFDDRFQDNHVIQLNPEGEVIYNRSVLEIVIETGLFNLTYDYDVYQTDLIHLNDIQPVFEDSEIAKRGDVYLSLGHLNMAMLFRPATDKVVWWSQSYMKHQHDIDIIGPDTIQIFDNRRRTGPDRNAITLGPNEMLRFELPDTNAKRFFLDPMKALDVRTKSQGLADTIPGSGIVMEDTNSGRLVKFDEAGEAEWTYLNRSEDGRVWTLNWSRYLPEQAAVAALEQLGKVSCQD